MASRKPASSRLQALGLMADPTAKPALETALKDKTAAVRLYALDALSMFGKLAPTDELKAMKEKDANRDVKAHVGFALDRDDKPDPVALRKTLAGFDLARMNTAVVGKAAPEFELTDATGKTYKLARTSRARRPWCWCSCTATPDPSATANSHSCATK